MSKRKIILDDVLGRQTLQSWEPNEQIESLIVGKYCYIINNFVANMAVYSISETKRAKDLNLRKYLEFLIKSRHNKNMSGKELK